MSAVHGALSIKPAEEPLVAQRAGEDRRGRRVLILVLGILLLSIADLAITLTHLRSVGMIEANPIAAYLIRQTNSAWVLSAYKAATVGFCIAVLYYVRKRRVGEVAAWMSLVICAGMGIAWHRYSTQLDDLDALMLARTGGCEHWLIID